MNISDINKKLVNKNIANKLIYIICASPAVFLLVNNYPYLLVTSLILITLIGVAALIKYKTITSLHSKVLKILSLIYLYFIFSYVISSQSLINFFSYNFLKYDGNFFICYILFFIFAIPFVNYKKVLNIVFLFLFITFTLFALVGIFEYFSGITSYMIGDDGTSGNMFLALNFAHNATGSVYSIVSLFLLIFLLKENSKKLRIIYLCSFIICFIGLFLTKSRGSYIGFFAGLLFVLWFHFKSVKKFFISVLVMLICSIPIIYLTQTFKRISEIFFLTLTSNVRLHLWDKAWTLFLKSPLLGIGFGRFNDVNIFSYNRIKGINGFIAFYRDPHYVYSSSTAHNSYLQFLAETGVIGLGLLLFFWISCFVIIFKAFKKASSVFEEKIYLSSLASIVVVSILSFTENYFSATTIMICISLVLSLSIGAVWEKKL